MENDTRPFQAINITLAGVERGRDRFTRDEMHTARPTLYWRCNLTALSQRYNLYFIAVGDGIAVYQPQFPFQKLHNQPKLFIPFELACPKAKGYIEPLQPHGANHILVGDLGTEEILLAATDSGNIVGYKTRAINDALKKDLATFKSPPTAESLDVRAFFSHWVHESAWGLAIHRQGRMIAVSANVPYHVGSTDMSSKITVFAFALTDSNPRQQNVETDQLLRPHLDQDAEWHDWDPHFANDFTPRRDKNYKITLRGDLGHKDNIPSVSFVNTVEDPHGSWLVSTDVRGEIKVWRIWQSQCVFSTSFAHQRERGWLVTALDPLAFRTTSSMDQFCGHSQPKQIYGHTGESYDITNIVRLRTPGHSQSHPWASDASDDELLVENDADEAGSDIETWSEEGEDNEDLRSSQNRIACSSLRSRVWIEPSAGTALEQSLTDEDASIDSTQLMNQSPAAAARGTQEDQSSSATHRQEHLTANSRLRYADTPIDSEVEDWEYESQVSLSESEEDDNESESDSDSGSEEQELPFSPVSRQSFTSASSVPNRDSAEVEEERVFMTRPDPVTGQIRAYTKTIPKEKPSASQNLAKAAAIKGQPLPFIPTLHTTSSHLRIVNAPQSNTPHVFCAHVLKQILPPGLEIGYHSNFDRLNMVQQIPELGIVVVATQIGRCAVCSLTKKADSSVLGIRVDWTLPTKRQERAGIRPLGPLLGIAVAPVQGRLVKRLEPDSDHPLPNDWDEERIMDGIRTTFDKNLLLLSKQEEQERKDEDGNPSDGPSNAKRRKAYQQSSSSRREKYQSPQAASSTRVSQERRTWQTSKRRPSWSAVEDSRRYRLMMTYSDMTVLTYELSRGIEMEDVAETEISALELVD